MTTSRLVGDRSSYEAIRTHASKVFDVGSRLPGMVFRDLAGYTLFCEFEAVLGAKFWPALTALAQLHGDDMVELLVVAPGGDSYYKPEYGMYPAASLATASSPQEYWKTISEEPRGDATGAIVFSAEVVAIDGPSGEWGCWGERNLGVALIRGVPPEELEGWSDTYGPFLEVEEALRQYVAPNFMRLAMPDELSSALTANYRIR